MRSNPRSPIFRTALRSSTTSRRAAFLQALARPGQHPLVITVSAGADTDLIDGVLEVGAPAAPADDSAVSTGTAIAVGGAAVLLAGVLIAWSLARRTASRRAA